MQNKKDSRISLGKVTSYKIHILNVKTKRSFFFQMCGLLTIILAFVALFVHVSDLLFRFEFHNIIVMYFRSFRRKMEISKLSRRFCRQIFP